MRRLTRVERRRRFSTIRAGLIAGLAAFLLFGTSGVAFALWSANANLTSTASTATVTVSQALGSGATLARTYTSSDLVGVGVVTVTNTGTRSGTYSLAIGGTSTSTSFPAAISVVIGEGTCTTTSALTSTANGTMAAAVTKTGTLAAGASIALCVRTSITAANVTANSGASLAGTAVTSITVGTWSASAATSIAFTQSIAAPTGFQSVEGNRYKIFNNSICIASTWSYDQISRGAVAGGDCNNDQTSNWRLIDDPSGAKYVARAYNTGTAPSNRWNATSANAVNLAAASDTTFQRWNITARPDGQYQFQNVQHANRCLEVASSGTVSLATCNTATAGQGFTFEVVGNSSPSPVTLTCGGNGTNYIYYSWPVLEGYQAEVTYKVYVNGIFVKDHTNGYSTSVQFNPTEVPVATYGSGVKTVQVRQSVAGAPYTVTGTGSITIGATTNNLSCN